MQPIFWSDFLVWIPWPHRLPWVRRLSDAEVVVLAKCLKVGIAELIDGFPVPQALSVVRQGAS